MPFHTSLLPALAQTATAVAPLFQRTAAPQPQQPAGARLIPANAVMMSPGQAGALGAAGASAAGWIYDWVTGQWRRKRRRRRHRLTTREIEELLVLKQLFGAKSAVMTVAGMRMLNRGG